MERKWGHIGGVAADSVNGKRDDMNNRGNFLGGVLHSMCEENMFVLGLNTS